MRKSIVADDSAPEDGPEARPEKREEWLDVCAIAAVEVTSEDPAYPIEAAFVASSAGGWRAAAPGEQVVRLRFDRPQSLRRISLEIDEARVERTQELSLGWRDETGQLREIVRQQWNFSPRGSTHEREDYRVTLDAVRVLELRIRPDIRGESAPAVASLSKLRLA